MKKYLGLIIISFLATETLQAAIPTPPTVNHNVVIMRQSSPAQCPSSWNGSVGPEAVSYESSMGADTGTAVGVQSCTGCSFDNNSANCVCSSCYGYYN